MKLYGVSETMLDDSFDPTTVGKVDDIASAVLLKFQAALLDRYVPLQSNGDGNCCFRSVALGIYGTESLHEYVRLLTAMEIITHRDDYDLSSKQYCGSFNEDRVATPPFEQLVSEVTTVGQSIHLIIMYGMY